MEQLQIFNNPDFGQVRTIEKDGNILFAASDVAKALGYLNPRDAIAKRCKSTGVAICDVGVITGKRADGAPSIQTMSMKFINSGNLYRLIVSSKLPNAVKFESWIFDDLVPNTLKNGGYLVIKKGDTPETLTERGQQVLQASVERLTMENEQLRIENKQKDELLEEMAPIVEYYNEAMDYGTTYSITKIAKGLGMGGRKLNKRLHQLGIQYRQGGTWLLYSKYENLGFTKLVPGQLENRNGDTYPIVNSRWTEKGRAFIHQLKREGKI